MNEKKYSYNTDMADERVDEYKVINNMSSIDGIEINEQKYDEFKIYGRINVNGSFNFRRRDFSSDFF